MTTRPELIRALAHAAGPEAGRACTAALGLPPPPGREEHTEVFVFRTHPYASVHLGAEGMIGGEAAERVAGFWRAIGAKPPPEPDDLVTLLELYARLGEEELSATRQRRASLSSARGALLWEHLASWVPVHLTSVQRAGSGFYRDWAALFAEALADEIDALPPRCELPVALADAPPRVDAGSRDALLGGLLVPVRSGIVVTGADLVAAGRQLGLALRRGERRFALEALVDQEPAGVLSWLAELAAAWSEAHADAHTGGLSSIGRWWSKRAAATAALVSTAAARVAACGRSQTESRTAAATAGATEGSNTLGTM